PGHPLRRGPHRPAQAVQPPPVHLDRLHGPTRRHQDPGEGIDLDDMVGLGAGPIEERDRELPRPDRAGARGGVARNRTSGTARRPGRLPGCHRGERAERRAPPPPPPPPPPPARPPPPPAPRPAPLPRRPAPPPFSVADREPHGHHVAERRVTALSRSGPPGPRVPSPGHW